MINTVTSAFEKLKIKTNLCTKQKSDFKQDWTI